MAGSRTHVAFDDNHRGLQLGQNFGSVYVGAGERARSPPEPYSNVPFRRDPQFVERATLTDQIRAKLSVSAGRVALVGLGGVGKSQIAIEYSYRYRDLHPDRWVLWIHASEAPRFEQSVRDVASLTQIPGRERPDADIFQLLRAWLYDKRNGHWLIILDNADDADFLTQRTQAGSLFGCLPVCDHGAMIITSRSKSAARMLVVDDDILDVPGMDEQGAVTLLTRRLGGGAHTAELRELAAKLDFMPLAMAQAAALLRRRGRRFPVQRYIKELDELNESKQGLLDFDHGDLRRDGDAANSIILTWHLSFDHISRARKSAANLLSLMSLCDRHAIPLSLVRGPDNEHPGGDAGFETDVEILVEYSFIAESINESTFEMHRLVQLATRKWMLSKEGAMRAHVDKLATSILAAFPWSDHTNVDTCETLYPHARSIMDLESHKSSDLWQWAVVMDRAASFACFRSGRVLLHQAMEMQERGWEAFKRQFGIEHRSSLASMSKLAECYYELGYGEKAAILQERCLEIMETSFGEGHIDTIISKLNLATYHGSLGNFEKATMMEEQCLAASSRLYGHEDLLTLTCMGNLAEFYARLGQTEKAVELQEQCWEGQKRLLGEEHPDTLTSMGRLAYCYHTTRDSRALAMTEQCWEAQKRLLGAEHPSTLRIMFNLANIYAKLGQSEKAAELQEQCWEAQKRQLGEENPNTLTSMGQLACCYNITGDSRALTMAEQCWEAQKRQLGEEHPETLRIMFNLAIIYAKLGQGEKAVELQEQCWETRIRLYGEGHLETIASMAGLAETYLLFGDSRAVSLGERLWKASVIHLGAEHPLTQLSKRVFAKCYDRQGGCNGPTMPTQKQSPSSSRRGSDQSRTGGETVCSRPDVSSTSSSLRQASRQGKLAKVSRRTILRTNRADKTSSATRPRPARKSIRARTQHR